MLPKSLGAMVKEFRCGVTKPENLPSSRLPATVSFRGIFGIVKVGQQHR
jgi:hypothetical protein